MADDLKTEVAELMRRLDFTPQKAAAWDAIQTFRRRGLLIAAAAGTVAEKEEMITAARRLLRDELLELVQLLGGPRLWEEPGHI